MVATFFPLRVGFYSVMRFAVSIGGPFFISSAMAANYVPAK